MQAILGELARRGSLVAPDAAARLEREPTLGTELLARPELPFLITLAHLPPAEANAPSSSAPADVVALRGAPSPVVVQPAAPAPVPAHVPAPFTPDTRGLDVAYVEPPVPAWRPSGVPLGPRPRLLEPYAHQWENLADVTGNSTCEGAMADFTKYFNDRLTRIRKLLKGRREMVGHVPIAHAKRGGAAQVKLIGIVTEVRTTKNGHRLLEIEDDTGSVAILAPASENALVIEADTVIEDEVIGVVCKPPGRSDLLILERIVRPDVPNGAQQRRGPNASAVAILSDLHFGAKTFLHEDWERFLKWINLEWGDSRMKSMARKVRYIVVNGDVVDGIGIFPGQEDELAIKDAYDQYAFAGEQLNRIRDDVRLFVLPGNHDLVRPAEPQPALPEKYRRLFPESVTHVGNPIKLNIEGMEFLSYHGRSMDDWITRVAGMSYERPIDTMKEMMIRRHMVPVYGLRTPIAPEHKDYLAIDTVPDVFITGHVHAAGIDQHRGVTLINASCWQAQTAYQKMHGFMPEPSKVAVVELDTGKPVMVDFHRGKPSGVDATGRSAFGEAFRRPVPQPDPGAVI